MNDVEMWKRIDEVIKQLTRIADLLQIRMEVQYGGLDAEDANKIIVNMDQ